MPEKNCSENNSVTILQPAPLYVSVPCLQGDYSFPDMSQDTNQLPSSPTLFTNQLPAKSESTCSSTSERSLTFLTWLPITASLSCAKKKKKRFSGTGKIVTQLPSLPTKRSTALSTRKWLFLLHLNKTLAAVIEDPEKVHLKLKCRTTFLSVQTDFSYLEKRPVIKTNTIPFTSCSLVCAHKNRLRVEMALSNT